MSLDSVTTVATSLVTVLTTLSASEENATIEMFHSLNSPEEYDDDEYYDTQWFLKFVPAILIYSVTFIVGFFGNLLVIFAIFYVKKLQSVTNLFLVSLATADLLLIVVCVPIKITEFFSHQWVFGPYMCKIFHYLQNFTAICSVINLTVMSLERYFAILYPLKARYTCTKTRAQIMIVAIWFVSFFAALPIIFGKDIEVIGTYQKVHICVRVWSTLAWKMFEIYRSMLILVIPFSIMLVTYAIICEKLWEMPNKRRRLTETTMSSSGTGLLSTNPLKISQSESIELTKSTRELSKSKSQQFAKNSSSNRPDDEKTRIQIIKMLICIVVIFFICWAPITINNLLVAFKILPNFNAGILWHLRLTFFIMSFINSAVNPIVYAFMSKNFREAFKHIFSLCGLIGGGSAAARRRRLQRFGTDSGSGRLGGLGGGGNGGTGGTISGTGGAGYMRAEFVRAGSEQRSSMLVLTKKTSMSSLNNTQMNAVRDDLQTNNNA